MPYANRSDKQAYALKHYAANKEAYKRRAAEYTREQRKRLRRLVLDHLSIHPCVDCGERDPVVLEFDHRDPKEKSFEIANGVRHGVGVSTMLAEIAKCDVRCANCHRRRTAKQWEDDEFGLSSAAALPLLDLLDAG